MLIRVSVTYHKAQFTVFIASTRRTILSETLLSVPVNRHIWQNRNKPETLPQTWLSCRLSVVLNNLPFRQLSFSVRFLIMTSPVKA